MATPNYIQKTLRIKDIVIKKLDGTVVSSENTFYDLERFINTRIKGNTSNAMRGSQSNGDCVAQKERGLSYIYQVFRPKY